MLFHLGPLATTTCEFRQAWKGATVAMSSCAGMWLGCLLAGVNPKRSKIPYRLSCEACHEI